MIRSKKIGNKFFLSITFFLLVSVFVFASGNSESLNTDSWKVLSPTAYPKSVSGDYIVYRDYSWTDPTWTGFLYYDDSTWGAFLSTPALNRHVAILFRSELVNGKMVLTGQNIVSEISQDDVEAVNYLMQLLPSLYSLRSQANEISPTVDEVTQRIFKRSVLLPSIVAQEKTVQLFGGPATVFWVPEISIFNLLKIRNAQGKDMLTVERAGRIENGGDSAFFAFTPIPIPTAGAKFELSKKIIKEAKKIDAVTVHLDSQWTMIADNTFLLGNVAVVIIDTLALSDLQIPRDNLPLSFVRFFSLSNEKAWFYPSSIFLTGSEYTFKIYSRVFDVQSGTVNQDIKYFVLDKDKTNCTVVSLSVSETAYVANQGYFDSLF